MELSAWQPRMGVALGRAAREELGAAASFCLPHPSVVESKLIEGETAVYALHGACLSRAWGVVAQALIIGKPAEALRY